MPPKKNARRSGCPISFALDTLGDKWSLLVVRDIVFNKKRFFGEFSDSREGIASNILADRLQRLELSGIIASSKSNDDRRPIYRLTDKGIDLVPLLLEMVQWGAKHDARTTAPKDVLARLKKDKPGLIEELQGSLQLRNVRGGTDA